MRVMDFLARSAGGVPTHSESGSELQPFVFTQTSAAPTELPEPEADTVLAVPFPLWSFEMDDGPITTSGTADVHCVVVEELYPGVYKFWVEGYAVSPRSRFGHKRRVSFTVGQNDAAYESMVELTRAMLKRVHGHYIGRSRCVGRIKTRDPRGKKRIYKPCSVIYVSHTKPAEESSRVSGVMVHWSGAKSIAPSSVRGHWRRLDDGSFGKDRNDNRCIQGYTWVVPHVRGGEDFETRVRKVTK